MRSARQILDQLQGEVARRLRAEPNFIDEQDIRAGLVKYLHRFEVVQETVDELIASISQAPGVQAPVAASSTYANGGGDTESSDGFDDEDDPNPPCCSPVTIDLLHDNTHVLHVAVPH